VSWQGPYVPEKDRALFVISYGVTIADSPQEAAEILEQYRTGVAIRPNDVTGELPFCKFSDRAIEWPGRIHFVRSNVVGGVSVHHLEERRAPKWARELARMLGLRIGEALAGRSDPVGAIPISRSELRLKLHQAFTYKRLGETLWGDEATYVAIQNGKHLPRLLPAKQIAERDFLVPLRALLIVLDPPSCEGLPFKEIHVLGQEITFGLRGKKWLLHGGSSLAFNLTDQSFCALSYPIEVMSGRTIVPVSLAESLMSAQFKWEHHKEAEALWDGKQRLVPLARIELAAKQIDE